MRTHNFITSQMFLVLNSQHTHNTTPKKNNIKKKNKHRVITVDYVFMRENSIDFNYRIFKYLFAYIFKLD